MNGELAWTISEGCQTCGESDMKVGGCRCERERPQNIMIFNMKIGEWNPVTEKTTFTGEFLDAIAEQLSERKQEKEVLN